MAIAGGTALKTWHICSVAPRTASAETNESGWIDRADGPPAQALIAELRCTFGCMSFTPDHRNQNQRRSVLRRGESDEPCHERRLHFRKWVSTANDGYRGEDTPRRFRLGERHIEIAEVVDSWLAPDHRYFKMQDTQGDVYILRNDVAADRWELTWLRRSETGQASPPTRQNPDDSR